MDQRSFRPVPPPAATKSSIVDGDSINLPSSSSSSTQRDAEVLIVRSGNPLDGNQRIWAFATGRPLSKHLHDNDDVIRSNHKLIHGTNQNEAIVKRSGFSDQRMAEMETMVLSQVSLI